jgi:hypothetical protein
MHRNRKQLLVPAGVLMAVLLMQWDSFAEYFEGSYADDVAIVAGAYCLAPEKWRGMFRQVIDDAAAPNKIRVECAADGL